MFFLQNAAMELICSYICVSDIDRQLADASVEELEACMGSAKNSRELREFLDASCPQL
jgi:hypothetical protein